MQEDTDDFAISVLEVSDAYSSLSTSRANKKFVNGERDRAIKRLRGSARQLVASLEEVKRQGLLEEIEADIRSSAHADNASRRRKGTQAPRIDFSQLAYSAKLLSLTEPTATGNDGSATPATKPEVAHCSLLMAWLWFCWSLRATGETPATIAGECRKFVTCTMRAAAMGDVRVAQQWGKQAQKTLQNIMGGVVGLSAEQREDMTLLLRKTNRGTSLEAILKTKK